MRAITRWFAMLVIVSVSSSMHAVATPAAGSPDSTALGDIVSVPIGTPCPPLSVVTKYKLLVDGAYTGIAAQGCRNYKDHVAAGTPDQEIGHIQFLLRKDSDPPAPETAVAWRTLIGSPWAGPGTARVRQIDVGVSDESDKDIAVSGASAQFVWSPLWKLWAGVFAFVVVVALFVYLGAKTSLLRDVGSSTSVDFNKRTFSLARTQMAWWTVIIVGSYIFEWIASGTMPPLSAQALALMGIYSVLTVGSRGVDLARETSFPSEKMPRFFRDLVSDESGVAIHRVQMLVFTVVVGVMFIYQVVATASMPALEPYTLIMIGISGATYIGLKSTEPQPKSDNETDAAAGSGPPAGNDIKSGYSTVESTP
ncbi:hypothetical protein G3N95_12125 [Paraburkholderia sp. Tr-20389]|uniref:hypothetical protein n=1 Tax=Paraburkholderia sp. Tr-20389 TaxID=2703903 RepID=UPI00197F0FD1|nr:hypothetical protein [Paraburkholderia sp. Tr-20389]MBN3753689.1 hypothetical protein [Paraburkholderia sp. Tr-20389]